MQSFPNCKLNIGLHVLNKRNDGYHNIETVMVPVSLCDRLEFCTSQKDTLLVSGEDIKLTKPEDNIVYKALQLCREIKEIPPLSIYLRKNIPSGAGLGGGSADAAFMIKMINYEFDMGLSDADMCNIALQLGSDCPFFIGNKPALATGRGEILSDIALNMSSYKVVIVHPNIHVSTAQAYAKVAPNKKRKAIDEIIAMPVEIWHKNLVNDFETSVFCQYPVLKEIKDELYNQGGVYAAMSGSGSSVYGIFNEFLYKNSLFCGFHFNVADFC